MQIFGLSAQLMGWNNNEWFISSWIHSVQQNANCAIIARNSYVLLHPKFSFSRIVTVQCIYCIVSDQLNKYNACKENQEGRVKKELPKSTLSVYTKMVK